MWRPRGNQLLVMTLLQLTNSWEKTDANSLLRTLRELSYRNLGGEVHLRQYFHKSLKTYIG